MDYCSDRTAGCRIYEYTHRRLKTVSLENELLRFTVIPDKGADITEILYKPKDVNVIWAAPGSGVRETGKLIPTTQSRLGNNLDYYEGGWHESFPGGGPYTDGGMVQGLHGEACLVPWDFCVIKDTTEEIAVKLCCQTVRFPARLEKTITMRAGCGKIHFEESLTNLCGEALPYIWGQHPVFGRPFLDESCEIEIDAETFETAKGFGSPTSLFEEGYMGKWPVDTGKDGQQVDLSKMPKAGEKNGELIFIAGLNKGEYRISNHNMRLQVYLTWDKALFDCMWYWRVTGGLPGYPWYGRTYNIGLEFWTGYPSFKGAKKNGTINTLEAKAHVETAFDVCVTDLY